MLNVDRKVRRLEGDAVAGWGLEGTSIGKEVVPGRRSEGTSLMLLLLLIVPIDAVVVDCSYRWRVVVDCSYQRRCC